MTTDCNKTFTNYKKNDCTIFFAFTQTTIPTNIHTVNRIFTNFILMADKHNIPKGKMHSTATTSKNIATVKHATHKTNISINRATQKIQGYNITLTTTQVHEAIKQSKNNNSQGLDKQNIRHLKHIGPLGFAFLTSMIKTTLNNIMPHIWKLDNIVTIPKPNKDIDKGSSYRPISLLSVIAKTLEKSLLPYITANGYKTQHSIVTEKGFNQMPPPLREQSL